MKYNELDLTSKKSKSRVGRGISAGQGKTAGRGTKGYGSRTGSSRRPGFEGGQNPMMKRLPKMRGFNSHTTGSVEVKLTDLAKVKGSTVNTETLHTAGLIANPYVSVKLIGNEKLEVKYTVQLQSASKGAEKSVTAAGGTFSIVDRTARPASLKKSEA